MKKAAHNVMLVLAVVMVLAVLGLAVFLWIVMGPPDLKVGDPFGGNSTEAVTRNEGYRAYEVGDYITFGSYEQDNNLENGKEAIEWLILDKQDDKRLVISRFGLDCQAYQPYNSELANNTWETCSLRNWLNGTFYESTFTPGEKKMIMKSTVTADANPRYDTPAGNDTLDWVFLLSIDEVDRYITDESRRALLGTPYCEARGVYKGGDGYSWWWLRTLGCSSGEVAVVYYDAVYKDGAPAPDERGAVRPAMWIDLSP